MSFHQPFGLWETFFLCGFFFCTVFSDLSLRFLFEFGAKNSYSDEYFSFRKRSGQVYNPRMTCHSLVKYTSLLRLVVEKTWDVTKTCVSISLDNLTNFMVYKINNYISF
jgi:hypothetical protein